MASSRIKGITIEIGGDTTKLDSALSGVNRNLSDTQRNLRDVNRLLKLDPSNTVLLEQKQRLLSSAINDTSKKLNTLKSAAEKAADVLKDGTMDQSQYDALQREIVDTERKLKDLRDEQKKSKKSTDDLEGSTDNLKESMSDFGNNAKTASDKLKTIAEVIAADQIIDKIRDLAEETEDYRDSISKLDTTAEYLGTSVGDARDALKQLYEVSGDESAAAEAANNLLNLKLQGDGLAGAVDLISGAVIRFPDTLKLESLADSLQETVATGEATGQFAELLGRLGVDTEEFSNSLGLYSDQSTRLDIALSAMATAGLADVTDAWKGENEELVKARDAQIDMKDAVADLAETVSPIVTAITVALSRMLTWFNNLSDGTKRFLVSFAGLITISGPAIDAIANISTIAKNLGGYFGGTAGAVLGVVAAVSMLIDIVPDMISKWKDMSPFEKAISVLGALAIAIAGIVVVVSALAGNVVGAMLAAAGMVAAYAAVKITLSNIKAPKVDYGNVPALADGAVLYPNSPFLAMVGDQRRGVNIEAPMSTIKQGVREVINERGGAGGVTRVEFTGSLAQLGRVLKPVISRESDRAGTPIGR